MSSSKLIDGGQLTAFERWELPNMGAPKPAVKVEEVDANEVQPLTAEQLAAIEDEARQEGYSKGFEQGKKEGLAAGKKQIDEAVRRLEKILKSFAEPLAQVNEAVEGELLALSLAVARQILRRELQQDPELILAVVREAISELPSAARQIKIFLHPDDAALVRAHYAGEDPHEQPWKIMEELGVSRGGCRIESQTSRIDATLEKRLDDVVAAIMGEQWATESTDDEDGHDSP